MRRDLEKRLEVLEEKAKPKVITTWVELMLNEDDNAELSPALAAWLETFDLGNDED